MLYFGSIVFTRGQFIVSIDGTQDKNYEKEYVYTIKDPFDRLHNPGRVKVA